MFVLCLAIQWWRTFLGKEKRAHVGETRVGGWFLFLLRRDGVCRGVSTNIIMDGGARDELMKRDGSAEM